MRQVDIAKLHGVSESLISLILKGDRHTVNKDIASSLAILANKKPIAFISPLLKKAYLLAYPEMGLKTKKSA